MASPFSLLPIGLAVISPIISMSNDTTGMKPNLPVLYTFPFLQNKREPNQTRCNIRLQGLGLISQLSLLCFRILAVTRQLDFCHRALEQTLFTVHADFYYYIIQKIFASL